MEIIWKTRYPNNVNSILNIYIANALTQFALERKREVSGNVSRTFSVNMFNFLQHLYINDLESGLFALITLLYLR